MKKLMMSVLAVTAVAGAAHADFQPVAQGGFVGGDETIITVKQAKEMRDDTYVIVQGKIVQRAGDDKYLFEDQTGSIIVEIDKKDWNGVTVTPNDTVKLYGEIDRGLLKTEIDVDYLQKVSQ
ncbi:MAG: YgiW/YdeI family stress tolerance OB fold protein [Alphaproteobacteria bacterium]|nr:YgiW/YdeI family stress tolerance OB fold protein [Alphaproteobacteria bacterium]